MAKKHQNSATRLVAIEVCNSTLRYVSVHSRGADKPADVHWRTVRWREKSSTLHSESGMEEMAAALKTLATEEKLAGAQVRFALNGDFCVTRVLTGTTDRVHREMAALHDRSQRYLQLGTGKKALAESVRQIDARHQHALLAVANQKTLDALVPAATAAGLQVELVEPSLVALSRLLGKLGADRDEPTMVINQGEKGVELGISYQGQLLLDYRPGGRASLDEVADIVIQHLTRLTRYCSRYFSFARGTMNRVCLFGDESFVQQVHDGFRRHNQLTVADVDSERLDTHWRYVRGVPGGDFAATLGTYCTADGDDAERNGPNLMEAHVGKEHRSLQEGLFEVFWPIAAVLLVAAGLMVLNYREARKLADLETSLAAYEPAHRRSLDLRKTLVETESKGRHLNQLAERVADPAWHDLLVTLGGCMPDDVWLTRLHVDKHGWVQLTGASYAEDGIYEFVRWLRKAPCFSQVALEGMRPSRTPSGSLSTFQIECKLVDFDDSNGGSDSNG